MTNGTTFNESLINKLKLFSRVGIEVSIESTTPHNNYVRQGTDTDMVLEHINKYIQHCTDSSISVTIRPAISALTVGYYHTLLDYCLQNKLLIKSLIVTDPQYLNIKILPIMIRQQYIQQYQTLLDKLIDEDISSDYNESDTANFIKNIKMQATQVISALQLPEVDNQEQLLATMVEHCQKWDKVYNLNAIELYPELKDIFTRHGY